MRTVKERTRRVTYKEERRNLSSDICQQLRAPSVIKPIPECTFCNAQNPPCVSPWQSAWQSTRKPHSTTCTLLVDGLVSASPLFNNSISPGFSDWFDLF